MRLLHKKTTYFLNWMKTVSSSFIFHFIYLFCTDRKSFRVVPVPVKSVRNLFTLSFIVSLALTGCAKKAQQETVTEPVAQAQEADNTIPTSAKAVAKADTVISTPAPVDSAKITTPVTKTAAVTAPDTSSAGAVKEENISWPTLPEPLPGSILPHKRIIAYYGNPLSKLMGILGEVPPDEMLARLDREVEAWQKADPSTPVQPALHVIMVTAQGAPGRDGKYRLRMKDELAHRVMEWAEKRDAIVFLDIQIGHSTLQDELPRLLPLLKHPKVHFAIDAEFAMREGKVPGKSMGIFDAADINYVTETLANLVTENQLPPKVFIVHRFTQKMITNYKNIKLDPRVQIVMHMDGWGHPTLKKDTYRRYIRREPVQYTGFKVFYKNDVRNGSRLMTPEEVLKLNPKPLYIQYQ